MESQPTEIDPRVLKEQGYTIWKELNSLAGPNPPNKD